MKDLSGRIFRNHFCLKLRNSWPSSYPLWKIAAGVDDVEFKGLPTEISDQVQRVVSTADESQVHIHPDTNLAVIKAKFIQIYVHFWSFYKFEKIES